MQYEVVVSGPHPGQGWRRKLVPGQVVRLGRDPQSDLAIPWELRLSREHADVCLRDDQLSIQCLQGALNPFVLRGERQRDFALRPGDTARIGFTSVRLELIVDTGTMQTISDFDRIQFAALDDAAQTSTGQSPSPSSPPAPASESPAGSDQRRDQLHPVAAEKESQGRKVDLKAIKTLVYGSDRHDHRRQRGRGDERPAEAQADRPNDAQAIVPDTIPEEEFRGGGVRSGPSTPPEHHGIRDTPRDAQLKRTLQPQGAPSSFSGGLHQGCEPIPGYRLEAFLGRGQYGEVWSAIGPGRVLVALKFIDLRGAQGLKEFRGVQRVKAIRHAHLMPITGLWMIAEDGDIASDEVLDDYDPSDDTSVATKAVNTLVEASQPRLLVVAMLLANRSLEDRLMECRKQNPKAGIPREELLGYMEEAAKGIDFLNSPKHDLGDGPIAIQHCDIKPANLVLVGNSVLICDFGLARLLGDGSATATGVLGSLAYMAPESIARRPSRASDQYALAITYYELRTGRLPFVSDDFSAVMDAHRAGKLDYSAVPPAEQEVLRRATALRPESRYANCSDLVRALRNADTEFLRHPARAARRRRRWVAILPAALLLLLCAVGAWAAVRLLLPPGPDPPSEPIQFDVRPSAPFVVIDDTRINVNSDGRFVLPEDVTDAFRLLVPAPDDDHEDYERTFTLTELSQRGYRIDYEFPIRNLEAVVPMPDAKALAREAAEDAQRAIESGQFDKAVALYAKAIEGDERYAVIPPPQVLPGEDSRCLKITPDGRSLITGNSNGQLQRWSLDELTAKPVTLAQLDGVVDSLDVSPSGRWVAAGTSKGSVVACELNAELHTFDLLTRSTAVSTLKFSPGDRMLAVATDRIGETPAVVHVWNIERADPTVAYRKLSGHTENINALAFSHDGKWLYSAGSDDRVFRWDTTANGEPEEFYKGRADILKLVCHPSQSIFVFGGAKPAKPATGDNLFFIQAPAKIPRELPAHLTDVQSIVFSDDGSRFVSSDLHGFVFVWTNGDLSNSVPLEGHSGAVIDAVFLSPGDWLATGCWDKVVGIWDLNARTKTPLRLTHPAMLASICASPDGHWLATLAEDGLVRIWDASQLKLLKRTCDKLERSPLPSQQKSHEPREARQLRPPNLHMAAN